MVVAAPPPTRREAARTPVARTPRVPLGRRRRDARKKFFLIILAALFGVFVFGEILLWQPFLRVRTVEAQGPSSEAVRDFVLAQLTGTRFLIVPRNSIFFVPEETIRTAVLAAFPHLDAVSIVPSGLTTLVVKGTPRAEILRWCGTLETPVTPCYQTDAQGFVFAQALAGDHEATSSILSLYAPLTPAPEGTTPPVGSTIAAHEALPALIQFIKTIRGLGVDVVSVVIRGDEADLYTRAGTRITYVLGREQQAAGLAASGFSSLNLNDGSLLYVDLRFDSKLFFKKKE